MSRTVDVKRAAKAPRPKAAEIRAAANLDAMVFQCCPVGRLVTWRQSIEDRILPIPRLHQHTHTKHTHTVRQQHTHTNIHTQRNKHTHTKQTHTVRLSMMPTQSHATPQADRDKNGYSTHTNARASAPTKTASPATLTARPLLPCPPQISLRASVFIAQVLPPPVPALRHHPHAGSDSSASIYLILCLCLSPPHARGLSLILCVSVYLRALRTSSPRSCPFLRLPCLAPRPVLPLTPAHFPSLTSPHSRDSPPVRRTK